MSKTDKQVVADMLTLFANETVMCDDTESVVCTWENGIRYTTKPTDKWETHELNGTCTLTIRVNGGARDER